MRWIIVLACAGLLVAAPRVARTEPAEAATNAAEPATPAKMALVRRYLRAIHYDKLVDGMMSSMLPVMAESTARSQPDLTATRQKLVVEVVREVMHDKMLPEMTERLVPIYAATFSESELQAIVTFYESPPGQAVVAKAPALAPQAASVLRSLMPEMQAEVMRRLCVRLNCNVDSRSLPKPS